MEAAPPGVLVSLTNTRTETISWPRTAVLPGHHRDRLDGGREKEGRPGERLKADQTDRHRAGEGVLRMGAQGCALPNGDLREGRKKSCLRPPHPAPHYTKRMDSATMCSQRTCSWMPNGSQKIPLARRSQMPMWAKHLRSGALGAVGGGAGGWRLWEWPEPSSRGRTHTANPQVLMVELAMASPKTKLLRSPREDWR